MRILILAIAILSSVTFIAQSFASVGSLKGSTLKGYDPAGQEQQEETIEDMRRMNGGSLGGMESGERQEEEERPTSKSDSNKEALSCAEALRRCQ